MRIFLFALGIYVAALAMGTPAQAQNYPWCAMYNMGDQAVNCGFTTFQQCLDTVRGSAASVSQIRSTSPHRASIQVLECAALIKRSVCSNGSSVTIRPPAPATFISDGSARLRGSKSS